MRKLATIVGVLLLMTLNGSPVCAAPALTWVTSGYHRGDFKLVSRTQPADILISPDDFKVVRIAADNLALDIEHVTGQKPAVKTEATRLSDHAVLVGTLGKNPLIDALVHDGKLDVNQLRGQWESFVIATVRNPLPNVSLGLVIVGSDRRGTAFGVFELSQAIGVSPWYWWADVTPEHRDNLFVRAGVRREGPPSVQYRGIFLNDEDWGLQPWAAKTFESDLGDIGPRTYARICELLLRLKANTLWPAMHECTRAFNLYPQNKMVADDYAIVMGSSHAEPMLRNNVTEWTGKPEDFDYMKNPDGVRRYWEERVEQNGRFENIYTLGMRGIHDSAMQGPKTSAERIKVLQQIFADQRALLAKHVNQEVTRVPQIFTPYKEVLTDYRNGLQVPDDVTIVWPDDNFGYIRYFPTLLEQERSGGFGVYYHISYLGRPLSYLWLETTPPALIWEEMSKAYDHKVRKFWMLNAGDLKPGEIGIEFFMQMAWDSKRWRRDNLNDFLRQWAQREFGAQHAAEIASVMDQYYRLGFARKPEHLQWYLPEDKPRASALTSIDYADEVQTRLDDYGALATSTNDLYTAMPEQLKDAFYELVAYPVRCAALANWRYFTMEKSGLYAAQGRASASDWAQRAQEGGEQIVAETGYYNEKLAGGKWRHMMSVGPNEGQWKGMRSSPPPIPGAIAEMQIPARANLGVAIEGSLAPVRANQEDAALPTFSVFTRENRFIDIFNLGRESSRWFAQPNQNWIKLTQIAGNFSDDARIRVSIDWANVPQGDDVSGMIQISAAGATRRLKVPIFNPKHPRPPKQMAFVESNGAVAIEAEHFTARIDRGGVGWQVIPGLGRSGDSVAIFPTTAATVSAGRIAVDAPRLEYQVRLFHPGNVTVTCYVVPTHPLVAGEDLRLAIGFDNQTPQVITIDKGLVVPSAAWSQNVLNATATGSATFEIAAAGPHVLKLYMIDAGVVLDKIVIDTGGVRPSYLGPPETRVVRARPRRSNMPQRH